MTLFVLGFFILLWLLILGAVLITLAYYKFKLGRYRAGLYDLWCLLGFLIIVISVCGVLS